MGNSFGRYFQIHSFGESHGSAMGVVIDGCPAGLLFDFDFLKLQLQRRKPGANTIAANQVVSGRNENDEPEILSGVFEGKTLGTPIAIMVRNQDQRSSDYDQIRKQSRTGHADDVWKEKFGHSDPRGGGRSSGRETLSRVIGGAVAQMFLKSACANLQIRGFARRVGPFELTEQERDAAFALEIDSFTARFPSERHEQLKSELMKIQEQGESWGGTAELRVRGVPSGLGQPVFHKMKSDLAMAMMSVGATCGFEMGDLVEASELPGTEFHLKTRDYAGIRGGITTGEEISFQIHMKPTSSILDVAKKGRHDPCLIPRAIPVFESMTALVLADHVLAKRLDRV